MHKMLLIAGLTIGLTTTTVMAKVPGMQPLPSNLWHPLSLPPADVDVTKMGPAELKAWHLPASLNQKQESPALEMRRQSVLNMLSKRGGMVQKEPLGVLPKLNHAPPKNMSKTSNDAFGSSNWAGPFITADPNIGLGMVTMSMSVPIPVACPFPDADGDCIVSYWPGEGGINELPLLQTGVLQDALGITFGGSPYGDHNTSINWAQCFPSPIIAFDYSFDGSPVSFAVWPAFDGVGGIVYNADYGTNETQYGEISCGGLDPAQTTTAEAITEAPSLGTQTQNLPSILPFAGYGIGVTDANFNFDPPGYDLSDPSVNVIVMVQNGVITAQPSPLGGSVVLWQTYPNGVGE